MNIIRGVSLKEMTNVINALMIPFFEQESEKNVVTGFRRPVLWVLEKVAIWFFRCFQTTIDIR